MTLDEAIDDIRAKRAALDSVASGAIDEVGRAAVARLKREWPRDTGLSGDSFEWDTVDKAVTSDVPYVPYVHDGLFDKLMPRIMSDLEPLFSESFTRRLDAVRSA